MINTEMKSLIEIQKSFGKAIRGEDPAEFAKNIIPGGKLDSSACVQVYRDGYIARLTSSLGETYETIWRILGDDAFFKLAQDYIRDHDSRSYNLSDYGASFPDHTASHYAEYPYLRSLAEFELVFKEVFHAEENPAFNMAEADLSNPEKLSFRFTESARLLSCEHSIFQLWNSRLQDDFILPGEAELNRPENYLLFRKDFITYCEILTYPEFIVLKSLFEGNSVETAVNVLNDSEYGNENIVSEIFSKVIQLGIVCGVSS